MATLLSPVQEGGIWRVRIRWPNGTVHHFGKFDSEQEAIKWIDAHPQLTKLVTEDGAEHNRASSSNPQKTVA
jgi:hypothetical protein